MALQPKSGSFIFTSTYDCAIIYDRRTAATTTFYKECITDIGSFVSFKSAVIQRNFPVASNKESSSFYCFTAGYCTILAVDC